jgi:hypothetical protein
MSKSALLVRIAAAFQGTPTSTYIRSAGIARSEVSKLDFEGSPFLHLAFSWGHVIPFVGVERFVGAVIPSSTSSPRTSY